MSYRDVKPEQWGMAEGFGFLQSSFSPFVPRGKVILDLWEAGREPHMRIRWGAEREDAPDGPMRLTGKSPNDCDYKYLSTDPTTWTLEQLGWMFKAWAKAYFGRNRTSLDYRRWNKLGDLCLERAIEGEVAFVTVEE